MVDLPVIPFPAEEHEELRQALAQGLCICTTRVLVHERLENHPNIEHLNDRMRQEIGEHPYDLVYLEKV